MQRYSKCLVTLKSLLNLFNYNKNSINCVNFRIYLFPSTEHTKWLWLSASNKLAHWKLVPDELNSRETIIQEVFFVRLNGDDNGNEFVEQLIRHWQQQTDENRKKKKKEIDSTMAAFKFQVNKKNVKKQQAYLMVSAFIQRQLSKKWVG